MSSRMYWVRSASASTPVLVPFNRPTKKSQLVGHFSWWARRDSNPQAFWAADFKSTAYTNSATRPYIPDWDKYLEAPTGIEPV